MTQLITNIAAEQAVLNGILQDEKAINIANGILSPDGSDFSDVFYGTVFASMVELAKEGEPVDLVTLHSKLPDWSMANLVDITESECVPSHIKQYCVLVLEASNQRKIAKHAEAIAWQATSGELNVEGLLSLTNQMTAEVIDSLPNQDDSNIKTLLKGFWEKTDELYETNSHITGISSGFVDLDALTAGLQDSDLIILAGRPSMGKTAFALNIMESVILSGTAAAIFSLEMSKEQLVQRLVSQRSGVNLSDIRCGRLGDEEWKKLQQSIEELYETPIYIEDSASLSLLEIQSRAKVLKETKSIGVVVIDYLQLIRGRKGSFSREQEVSEIARGLKVLAKELHIPVLCLSQLNRKTEERIGGRPVLSDLRESGAIEQDADMVMFVYRESEYNDCDCPEICTCGRRSECDIIIAKQRNGPTGTVKLRFDKECTRFTNQMEF